MGSSFQGVLGRLPSARNGNFRLITVTCCTEIRAKPPAARCKQAEGDRLTFSRARLTLTCDTNELARMSSAGSAESSVDSLGNFTTRSGSGSLTETRHRPGGFTSEPTQGQTFKHVTNLNLSGLTPTADLCCIRAQLIQNMVIYSCDMERRLKRPAVV